MKILVAEDDAVSSRVLSVSLERWGHEVRSVEDGRAALDILLGSDPPGMAILDWMMPEMDGIEVCRRIRAEPSRAGLYIIILTARSSKEDTVSGLSAGADDYVTKPFDPSELRARVATGVRIVELARALAQRVGELEQALDQVRHLQGLLPICSYCKSIRDDQNYWHRVEEYISEHSSAVFSHGICPRCMETVVRQQIDELKRQNPDGKPK